MVRSLNPKAKENVADSAGDSPPESPPASSGGESNEPRRNFLVAMAAGTIGFVLSLFPIAAGALTILDPLFGRKRRQSNFIRVASLESLPEGTPVQVPVLSDRVDAWNKRTNQPIGAVYLQRDGDKVVAFNAICPHAGCFVGYDADETQYQCPCHTSAFKLDGARVLPSPSPRDMDDLTVDEEKLASTGEVWVDFVNYYAGKAERIAKS